MIQYQTKKVDISDNKGLGRKINKYISNRIRWHEWIMIEHQSRFLT